MLVLSRKKNESIILRLGGEIVRIALIEIRDGKCRLGIEAPANVQVDREEVFNAKRGPKPPSEAA